MQLIQAKQRLINGDSSALKEIKNLENDLKVIDLKDLEVVKFRSRSQWIEDGEKPSRFFFGLEKKRANDNFISSLLHKDDQPVSSKDDLCATATEFYKNLFTASPTDNDIQQELINNLDATLSTDNADICEGPITLNELYEAALQMSFSKTPGLDGLPTEFYLKFWGRIGTILVDIFNESFNLDHLPSSQQISIIRLIYKKFDKRLLKTGVLFLY